MGYIDKRRQVSPFQVRDCLDVTTGTRYAVKVMYRDRDRRREGKLSNRDTFETEVLSLYIIIHLKP